MYAGRIMERAPTATLFRDMRMPYTEALFRSIPKIEYPSHTKLAIIPGRPPNMVDPPKGCKFAARCRYAQERCSRRRAGADAGHGPRSRLPLLLSRGQRRGGRCVGPQYR